LRKDSHLAFLKKVVHGTRVSRGLMTFESDKFLLTINADLAKIEKELITENSHKIKVPDSSVKAIEDLIARFSRNKDQYRNPAYKEDQCRIEFINPFFEALGWDIANKQAGRAKNSG